jgi:starch phosphorylase
MLDLIKSNFFSPIETDAFLPLARTISEDDPFFICADFEAYCAAQAKAAKLYRDRDAWLEKSIINTAKSGRFSSDRTIREYAEEIWKVPVKE